MRRASVRDLHINTSALVKDAAAGEVIVIESPGEPIAELRPLPPRPTKRLPNRDKSLSRFPRIEADSGKILEKDRS
jgi:antitoxin (DNA-binding transcriptional repressor) of toxin-antitoxin stability system